MDTVKTIKGVPEDTWAEFKSLAAKKKMSMPEFLRYLVDSQKDSSNWLEEYRKIPKILTEKEAKAFKEQIRKMRNEWEERI
jgi:hypothetical protein